MNVRKRTRRTSNSLGQIEEGAAMRGEFDRLWGLIGQPVGPLSDPALTPERLQRQHLIDYMIALDAALSGVSIESLSKLLRSQVPIPPTLLPFVARAYELPPRRGAKPRITEGARFYLYLRILHQIESQCCTVNSAIDQICSRLSAEGRPISEEMLRNIWSDYSEADRAHQAEPQA